ncbi:RNA polymerase sigma factor [Arthrobacter sp. NPDC097144]|uniref:RNA polymerase sigma factor n=1 Tax=Arthrobacter sp. NPDC097144 TaxID=3363946 RepID=UPI0038170EA2
MGTEDRAARVENATREHAPALLAYFARRVDQSHDAADLLAETLLILWRRASSLPTDDAEVRPWMFGIGRNVLMHHRRRAIRQRAVSDRLRNILSTTPRSGFAEAVEHDSLHRALAGLDPIDQDIIGLVHWDGFSLVEVSRIIGMKEGTVRSRYHRARLALRTQLEEHLAHQP